MRERRGGGVLEEAYAVINFLKMPTNRYNQPGMKSIELDFFFLNLCNILESWFGDKVIRLIRSARCVNRLPPPIFTCGIQCFPRVSNSDKLISLLC